ncbi:MAG: polyribonucleotide nucleotidyltransferase, partial [Mesorhizobium sp.]
VVTVVQHDLENDPDILSIVATSAALTLSGVPFMGPVGGARVGYINGEYVLNPHVDEMQESKLDLVVAGTADAVLMVESAKDPRDFTAPDYSALEAEMLKIVEGELRDAYKITDKQKRYAAVDAVKAKVKAAFAPAEGEEAKYTSEQIGTVFKELQAKVVRWNILDTGSRIDGRDLKTVRKIVSEVGVLPRTHGSALFTRGETQALVVATLGTGEDEQYVDSLTGMYKEKFLLHYN